MQDGNAEIGLFKAKDTREEVSLISAADSPLPLVSWPPSTVVSRVDGDPRLHRSG